MNKSVGVVLLDYPYMYELDGKKLYCNKEINNFTHERCNGLIDYDTGFNNLICAKCGKTYLAQQLKQDTEDKKIIIKGANEMKWERVINGKTVSVHNEEHKSIQPVKPIVNKESKSVPFSVEFSSTKSIENLITDKEKEKIEEAKQYNTNIIIKNNETQEVIFSGSTTILSGSDFTTEKHFNTSNSKIEEVKQYNKNILCGNEGPHDIKREIVPQYNINTEGKKMEEKYIPKPEIKEVSINTKNEPIRYRIKSFEAIFDEFNNPYKKDDTIFVDDGMGCIYKVINVPVKSPDDLEAVEEDHSELLQPNDNIGYGLSDKDFDEPDPSIADKY